MEGEPGPDGTNATYATHLGHAGFFRFSLTTNDAASMRALIAVFEEGERGPVTGFGWMVVRRVRMRGCGFRSWFWVWIWVWF